MGVCTLSASLKRHEWSGTNELQGSEEEGFKAPY